MRSFARKVLRPFLRVLLRVARPVTAKIRTRIFFWARQATDIRFENLERQMAVANTDIDGLERYMPAVLNAIASQNAMNRANVRSEEEIAHLVRSVFERFDAALREVAAPREETHLDAFVEPKVLHPERVNTAGELRLNLGCGRDALPGYVNIDSQAFDEVDVLADPRNLPFDQRSVAEIRSVHVLQRFSASELKEVVLPHWVSLLEPGGSIVAVVPDVDSMIKSYVAGELEFEALRDRTFGETHDPPMTMFSRDTLSTLFADAGLEGVSVRNARWPEPTHEIEVVARSSSASAPG